MSKFEGLVALVVLFLGLFAYYPIAVFVDAFGPQYSTTNAILLPLFTLLYYGALIGMVYVAWNR